MAMGVDALCVVLSFIFAFALLCCFALLYCFFLIEPSIIPLFCKRVPEKMLLLNKTF